MKKKKKKTMIVYEMKKNFSYRLKYTNTHFSVEMKIWATNALNLYCKHRCLALLQLSILKGFLKLRYVWHALQYQRIFQAYSQINWTQTEGRECWKETYVSFVALLNK